MEALKGSTLSPPRAADMGEGCGPGSIGFNLKPPESWVTPSPKPVAEPAADPHRQTDEKPKAPAPKAKFNQCLNTNPADATNGYSFDEAAFATACEAEERERQRQMNNKIEAWRAQGEDIHAQALAKQKHIPGAPGGDDDPPLTSLAENGFDRVPTRSVLGWRFKKYLENEATAEEKKIQSNANSNWERANPH